MHGGGWGRRAAKVYAKNGRRYQTSYSIGICANQLGEV